ncbi:MAG: secretin N-terminal domain-containing protein [Chthoniobacterales bacterium]
MPNNYIKRVPRRLCLRLAPLIVLAVSASAQIAGPTPFVPPGAAGARARPGLSNRTSDMVTMQYPNSDVLDVLHLYENLTGKKLVMDNNVQGKVNIFISRPIPREEAIRIIEMNMALNGYSLVPAEGDIIEVIGINKNPRAAAVPIISDPADLPTGATVVSYLFRLEYADPQELQQVLAQYLAGIGGQAPILALPKSSSLLVTQSADVLRKLVKMVEQIDVAPATVTSTFFKLERADAQKVVDMMKDIFEKGDQSSQPGGVRRVRGIIPPAGQPGGEEEGGGVLSEESLIVGKIKLEADVRTNRIHVITRPINLPFIEKLIAEFDANVEFGKPVVRPLKYIAAADVLPVLVQALTEPGNENQQGQGLPSQQQGRNNPHINPTPSNQNTTTGQTGESNLQVSEELSTEPVDTAPQAVTVGNTKLIADARANSIIVLGNRDVVVKVTKILDDMDVKAPQVALSTVIGELTLNNSEEFGVDYFLQFKKKNLSGGVAPIGVGGGLNNNLGNVTNNPAPIIDPASLITYPAFSTLPTSATAYVAAGNTLSAIVQALDSTGRFRTISRPTVFTSNNKKAIIASGEEIPVPTNTISSSTGGGIINTGLAQQTNIDYKKVALQLEVVPLINSEKEVSLDILQKLDSVSGSQQVSGNSIPIIATRYIKTTVSAPTGSTIVLGGLIQDAKLRNRTGFPILNRIPLLGALFSDTGKTKMRTELIVLMRPEVTLTKLDLYRLRQKHEDHSHFGPELEQDDCPDCPPLPDGKQLPPPDLPPTK